MLEATKQAGFEGFTEATQELIQATAVGMMRNDPTGGFAEYADEFVRNLENLEADEQLRSRLLNAASWGYWHIYWGVLVASSKAKSVVLKMQERARSKRRRRISPLKNNSLRTLKKPRSKRLSESSMAG